MKQLLFESTADRIQSLIDKDLFRPGDKLPSLRRIHRDFEVSIGTVLEAYNVLSDRGIVTGREKSGFFVVRKPGAIADAPTPSNEKAVEKNVMIENLLKKVTTPSAKKNIVSFFDAVPTVGMLPFTSLRRAVQNVSRDLSGAYMAYESSIGNTALREMIARRAVDHEVTYNANDIIITNGALEGINLCLRAVTSPGDTVLVQTPCYYGILQCIANLKLKVIEIPSDTSGVVHMDELEKVCKKSSVAACILVPNFNNPNGVTLSDETKKLLALFAKRMRVPIIEDDIYGDLCFSTRRPSTIKSYDRDGWILLVSSFSKTLAPGFRVGWCIPGRFLQRVAQLKATTNVATASLVQHAIASLLKTNAYDRHIRKTRSTLSRQVALTSQAIHTYFPEGTKISQPEGGFVLWVELPKKVNTLELQKMALDHGINFAPGTIFSNSGQYKNFLRISCNNEWTVRVEHAIRKLGQLCGK